MSEYRKASVFETCVPAACVLALTVLSLYFIGEWVKGRSALEEVAIKPGSSVVRGTVDGRVVHCEGANDIELCSDGFQSYPNVKHSVLWLGNSQLHTINQMESGDRPAPSLLHEYLRDEKAYLLTFSQGNANLQEHFILFKFFIENSNVDLLILPVFFDDMRETGIRQNIGNLFNDIHSIDSGNSYVGNLLSENDFVGRNNENSTKAEESDDLDGLSGSVQLGVEWWIDGNLSEISSLWRSRGDIRGNIFLELFKLRNFIFGIDATTIRRQIPARYKANEKALDEIIDTALQNNVKVLLYIPPLRMDKTIPYDLQDYEEFKADLRERASLDVEVLDLEAIIPGNFWGLKDSTDLNDQLELDFMHFKSEGHEILADSLYQGINYNNLLGCEDDI